MSLFCLVHGSAQSSAGWTLLVEELQRRGHQTIAVDLPTDARAEGAEKYADVIAASLPATGEAVVVAHSASGIFLPLVPARRRVARLVFLAAFVPSPGVSPISQYRADPSMFNPSWIGRNPMDDAVAREFLFHDCRDDVLAWALTTRQLLVATGALEQPLPISEWPRAPCSSIVCADDRTLSPAWSRRAARERLGVEPVELPGGHCPFVSRPAALADVLGSLPA